MERPAATVTVIRNRRLSSRVPRDKLRWEKTQRRKMEKTNLTLFGYPVMTLVAIWGVGYMVREGYKDWRERPAAPGGVSGPASPRLVRAWLSARPTSSRGRFHRRLCGEPGRDGDPSRHGPARKWERIFRVHKAHRGRSTPGFRMQVCRSAHPKRRPTGSSLARGSPCAANRRQGWPLIQIRSILIERQPAGRITGPLHQS
jgi:hypothetical protein